MSRKCLCVFLLLMMVILIQQRVEAGHKKVIIHVPYLIKNIKHTHTVYKIVKHKPHHHGHWKKESNHDDYSDGGYYN